MASGAPPSCPSAWSLFSIYGVALRHALPLQVPAAPQSAHQGPAEPPPLALRGGGAPLPVGQGNEPPVPLPSSVFSRVSKLLVLVGLWNEVESGTSVAPCPLRS